MNFEKELIDKLKKQDPTAFNEFYLQTVDTFSRYINANFSISSQDSQDIISDFYVKRWESIKTYDEKQSFTWYFWTIFKNTIKDYFKKNSDTPFTHLESLQEDSSNFEDTLIDGSDFTEILEHDYKFDQIQNAMIELDISSKDIIYWKYIEEKSNEEISNILWISEENIRQKISRAIKHLKTLLETDLQ